jgi:hypothetical protein
VLPDAMALDETGAMLQQSCRGVKPVAYCTRPHSARFLPPMTSAQHIRSVRIVTPAAYRPHRNHA